MYQRDIAESRRPSTSDVKYYLVAGGELVASHAQGHAISAASVSANWQLQPSTVVNVKIVKMPTTNCSSVERTSNPDAVSDMRYRMAPRMQTMSPSQLSGLVVRGSYMHGQSSSATPSYQSAVGQPDIRPSLQQTTVNRRSMQGDVLPQASSRESIPLLQQLTDELQQQKWETGSAHCYAGSSKQSVVRPVPVKAQPGSMPRFHPLMSSPSHVPTTMVVPSVAQNASQQAASYRTMQSSNEADYVAMSRSPRLSQNSLRNTSLLPSHNTDSYRFHPASANQSVTVTHSVQFGSQDRSSTGRRYPTSSATVKGSFLNPTWSDSNLTSGVHEQQDLSWRMAHCSPVHSYQSPSYSSHQNSAISAQNYHCPTLCLPTPNKQMQSQELQSAKLASPRYMSAKQYAAVSSPAKSAPCEYSSQQFFSTQCSPKTHYTPSRSLVSDAQVTAVSSLSRMTSDLHHRLGSPVPSHIGQDSTLVESLRHGSTSKLISPRKVICLSNKN